MSEKQEQPAKTIQDKVNAQKNTEKLANIREHLNKVMAMIHTPQAFDSTKNATDEKENSEEEEDEESESQNSKEEDSEEEQEEIEHVKKSDFFAIAVRPNGSWQTCNYDIKYKKYNKNDEEYYIDVDNKTPITNCKKVIINNVSQDRYSELDDVELVIEGDLITEYDLVESVRDFYHRTMTKEELEAVSETDDGWGYSTKAQEALENDEKLIRHEIMGDCVWFEGLGDIKISKKGNGVATYQLFLGS